jgi:ParB/RepB/Spo0J family partition protein
VERRNEGAKAAGAAVAELESPPVALPSAVEHVELARLDASPLNPASRSRPDPVLVESIRELGLLQPIVVRPKDGGRFDVLAGHRRLAAVRELAWLRVPALLFKGTAAAGVVLLAENADRKDLDPLEEAAIVGALREQATQEQVAKGLGRSVFWVARRENLAQLSPLARRAIKDGPLKLWPPAWLEELALVDARSQDAFLLERFEFDGKEPKNEWVRRGWGESSLTSVDEVRAELRAYLRPLRLATWKLDDEKLQRSAGSCLKCPKTSCARPALFGVEPGEPSAVENATCTDVKCWDGKRAASLVVAHKAALAEHGAKLLLVHGKLPPRSDGSETPDAFRQRASDVLDVKDLLGGARVVEHWQWEPGSKTKGRPALVTDGARAGEVVYVREKAESQSVGVNGRGAAGPKSLKEKRAELHQRRCRKVLGQLAAAVLESEWKDVLKRSPGDVKPTEAGAFLLVMFRSAEQDLARSLPAPRETRGRDPKKKAAAWPKLGTAIADAWLELRDELGGALEGLAANARDDAGELVAQLAWLGDLVGLDVAVQLAAMKTELPEPKSWKDGGK